LTHYDDIDESYKNMLGLQKKEIPIVDRFSIVA